MNTKQFNKLRNEYRAFKRVYKRSKSNFDSLIMDYIITGKGMDVNILYRKLQSLRDVYRDYDNLRDQYNFEINCRKEG